MELALLTLAGEAVEHMFHSPGVNLLLENYYY